MPARKIPPFAIEPPAAGFTTVGALVADLQQRREWTTLRQRPVAAFAAALLAAASPLRRRADNATLAAAEAEILALLRRPGVTYWKAKEIAAAMRSDVSQATTHNILRQLVGRGVVVKSGRTHDAAYRLAETVL